MIKEQKIHAIEFTVIILLWTLVVISPLLFMSDYNQNWRAVHVMWTECAVVGFAFIVNRFILMPNLFFTKRYIAYIGSLIVLFLIVSIFVLYFDGVNAIMRIFGDDFSDASLPLPYAMESNLPPMQSMQMHRPPHAMPPQVTPPINSVIPPTISVIVLSIITIALDIGLSITKTWIISEQTQAHADRERVEAQLFNLQSQVSPHFLMNTLNNIHALVDIDSERAKQTIIELSGLMNYLLYESSSKRSVSLQRELDFIGSYVHLMRMRFPEKVKISLSHSESVPEVKIPPLIFINFIENAFKYGIDYEQKSFIKIRFNFTPSTIEMIALNSNHSQSVKRDRRGLGIKNSRKRLDLLYADGYTLDISEKDMIYFINLKIPIL